MAKPTLPGAVARSAQSQTRGWAPIAANLRGAALYSKSHIATLILAFDRR